jgi:asparagine synthase (glutamine-hydrolysing)
LPDRLHVTSARLPDELTPELLKEVDVDGPRRLMREVYHRARASHPLNRLLYLDLKIVIADNDLRKVGRMCEVAGIEARYPFLDEEMVEFAARIPPEWKMRRYELRSFFKEALRDFLPSEVVAKRKHGFGLPFGMWMREDSTLREMTEESMKSLKTRGIYRDSYIDQLLQRHQSENSSYYGVFLWQLMMFEQWLQHQDAEDDVESSFEDLSRSLSP